MACGEEGSGGEGEKGEMGVGNGRAEWWYTTAIFCVSSMFCEPTGLRPSVFTAVKASKYTAGQLMHFD
jgi:hypothetical protein